MTAKPRHAGGGFVNPKRLPRGPNGRALCRWCRTEVPKGRRTFCSEACVDEHVVRASSAGAARVLLRRDGGVCALCGLDCEWLRKIRSRYFFDGPARHLAMERSEWERLVRRLGFPTSGRHRLWDVDHIVPVVEGGGSCGPENLRTLCIPCHRSVTAELAARLARSRRKQAALFGEEDIAS